MDKIIVRSLKMVMVGAFVALASFSPWQPVHAQSALATTQIVIGAPATTGLGKVLTVQALLADNQGHPISKETIYFTTRAKFLGDQGSVVLAQAVTNAKGQAVAQFADDFSGSITLSAEFRGDAQYAASNASAQVGAADSQQVYAEHIGVDLPGFNVPPVGTKMASVQSPLRGVARFIQSLWPAMNGWPVAAVLLLVWSMYMLTVKHVFGVAAAGSEPEELPAFDSRRV